MPDVPEEDQPASEHLTEAEKAYACIANGLEGAGVDATVARVLRETIFEDVSDASVQVARRRLLETEDGES